MCHLRLNSPDLDKQSAPNSVAGCESRQCPGGSDCVKRQLGLETKAGGCLEHLLRGHGGHQEGGPRAAGSRPSKSPTSRLVFTSFPRSISTSPKPSVKSCKSRPRWMWQPGKQGPRLDPRPSTAPIRGQRAQRTAPQRKAREAGRTPRGTQQSTQAAVLGDPLRNGLGRVLR